MPGKQIDADPPADTWLPHPESDPRPDGPNWLPGSYQLLQEYPDFRWPDNDESGISQRPPADVIGSLLGHCADGTASYLFLDEIVAGEVSLVVHDWPVVDDLGRLWFDTSNDLPTIDVDVDRFQGWLNQQRQRLADFDIIDAPLATRRVAVGDCYAVVIEPGHRDERVRAEQVAYFDGHAHVLEAKDERQRHRLLVSSNIRSKPGPLLDVTWDAQNVSSAAYFAAATRPRTRLARLLSLDATDDPAEEEIAEAARSEAIGVVPDAAQDPSAIQDLSRRRGEV